MNDHFVRATSDGWRDLQISRELGHPTHTARVEQPGGKPRPRCLRLHLHPLCLRLVQSLRLQLNPLHLRYPLRPLRLWYLLQLCPLCPLCLHLHPLLRRMNCVEPLRRLKLLARVSRLQKCAVGRSEPLRLAHHLQTAGADRVCMWAVYGCVVEDLTMECNMECTLYGHHVFCGTRACSASLARCIRWRDSSPPLKPTCQSRSRSSAVSAELIWSQLGGCMW